MFVVVCLLFDMCFLLLCFVDLCLLGVIRYVFLFLFGLLFFVVLCCSLLVVRCALCVVRCLLLVGCWLVCVVVSCFSFRVHQLCCICVRLVDCSSLFVACWLLVVE